MTENFYTYYTFMHNVIRMNKKLINKKECDVRTETWRPWIVTSHYKKTLGVCT